MLFVPLAGLRYSFSKESFAHGHPSEQTRYLTWIGFTPTRTHKNVAMNATGWLILSEHQSQRTRRLGSWTEQSSTTYASAKALNHAQKRQNGFRQIIEDIQQCVGPVRHVVLSPSLSRNSA